MLALHFVTLVESGLLCVCREACVYLFFVLSIFITILISRDYDIVILPEGRPLPCSFPIKPDVFIGAVSIGSLSLLPGTHCFAS